MISSLPVLPQAGQPFHLGSTLFRQKNEFLAPKNDFFAQKNEFSAQKIDFEAHNLALENQNGQTVTVKNKENLYSIPVRCHSRVR